MDIGQVKIKVSSWINLSSVLLKGRVLLIFLFFHKLRSVYGWKIVETGRLDLKTTQKCKFGPFKGGGRVPPFLLTLFCKVFSSKLCDSYLQI